MEDYDMGITERIVNKKGEDYLKLKQSIVTYPNPEGKKPLEINVLCSKALLKENNFKEVLKDFLEGKLEKEEIEKLHLKAIVVGGNNRVSIFRQLCSQFKNESKTLKFFEKRPATVYLNLEVLEMDLIGSKSNEFDEIKVVQSEVEILKCVRRKFLHYQDKLQKESGQSEINIKDVWKYEISYGKQITTLSSYVIVNKIMPFKNTQYHMANTYKQFASFPSDVYDVLLDILENGIVTLVKGKEKKEKPNIFSFQFLLGKNENEDMKNLLTRIQEGQIKIKDAKDELASIKTLRNFNNYISNYLFTTTSNQNDSESKKSDFFESFEYDSLKKCYLSLFSKNLKFQEKPHFFVIQRGKSRLASVNEETLKTQFLITLKKLKNNLFVKEIITSSQQKSIEESLEACSDLVIVENETHFGFNNGLNSYLFFNDHFPTTFKPFTANLLFCDIPYDNQEKGDLSNLEYNTPIDLDLFVKSISSFQKCNTNKNFNLIIFASKDQIEKIKFKLEEHSKNTKVTLYFHDLIWYKNKYKIVKFYPNSFLNQTEVFMLVCFSNDLNSHSLLHNNIPKALEISNLKKKINKVLEKIEGKKKIVEKINLEIDNHFSISNKQSAGSNVFVAPQGEKFVFNNEILNHFEKPQLLLENIIESFSKENDMVYEFCFGSGSLAETCLKTKRSYRGYEISQNQFLGAKMRITIAIK